MGRGKVGHGGGGRRMEGGIGGQGRRGGQRIGEEEEDGGGGGTRVVDAEADGLLVLVAGVDHQVCLAIIGNRNDAMPTSPTSRIVSYRTKK